MIHMPDCPLMEPGDESITDVDEWDQVDCERCKQPVIRSNADVVVLNDQCTCPMIGRIETCSIHGAAVVPMREPARVRTIKIIGEVDWRVVRDCMDQVFSGPTRNMEENARTHGAAFSHGTPSTYTFNFEEQA